MIMSNPTQEIADLEAERLVVEAKINNAYWAFTRQARAKPPSLVCPEAYSRRTQIDARLRELRRAKP